jgi:hypothetical protein
MDDLNRLAQQAKKQLEKQEEEDKNIYQELIEEQNEEEQPVYSQDQAINYDIKNQPDGTPNPNPYIYNEPEDDEIVENPTINEYDKPIFPGGPLESQINSWKKQLSNYDMFMTEVGGDFFVFRTLNRYEYKQICALKNTDPLQREEIICETCTLWPKAYKFDKMATGKAGTPSTLAQVIMEKSGFTKEFQIQIL